MPANERQDRKARKQERIAKFLAKVSQLPDDMIAPDPESAAMLGISEWTLRRTNPVAYREISERRGGRRLGDVRALVRGENAAA
jgi:hypothetical protein